MAEYVRFRLAAAKVGASMALLALVGGVADKARAATSSAGGQASASKFLKLSGLTKTISYDFLKLEQKLNKVETALAKVEQKIVRSYYTKSQINDKYLKITDANAKFLKVTDANAKFLKITDASTQYLKIADANGKFLQGKGAVLSNSLLLPAVQTGQQVLLGDGSVRVLIGLDKAGAPSVTLENDTNSLLNFTVIGARGAGGSIAAGGQAALTPSGQQMDIQMFGDGGGAGKVWTITLSNVSTQAGEQFVGQMLIGLL